MINASKATLDALDSIKSAVPSYARAVGASFLSGTTNAVAREGDYLSNMAMRNVVPSLDELLRLFYGRYITYAQLLKLAGWHGIDLTGGLVFATDTSDAWSKVLAMHRPEYDLTFLRELAWRGIDGADAQLNLALQKQGFTTATHSNWFKDYTRFPDLSVWVNNYLLGGITETELVSAIRKLGFSDLDAAKIREAVREVMGVPQALAYFNYGVLGESEVRSQLRANGFDDANYQNWLLKGRFTPPSVSGLVGAARRQTWDDVFAEKWGLDDDKPPQYTEWARRLGLAFSAGTDAYGTVQASGGGQAPTIFGWDKALWRESAQLPSLGELAEIIHRFRGDPNSPNTWSQPGYPPLSQDDVWRALTANGLPTLSKNYWGRLVYSPIGFRQARVMVLHGGWTVSDLEGNLQDNGLSPADAAKVAPALYESYQPAAKDNVNALDVAAWKRLIKAIEGAYSAGVLTQPEAVVELNAQGLSAALAERMLSTIDIEENTALMKELVARTRSEIMSGAVTIPQAAGRLVGAGMDPQRVDQLAKAWTLAFTERKRRLATGQVQKYLRNGLLTRDQAIQRLSNLGWTSPDELLLLAEVKGQVLKDEASAVKALEAKVKGQEREIITSLKGMASTASKLQSRLKTLTPVSSIMNWYKDGLWDEGQVRNRLHLLGYPDDVIDTMLLAKLGLPAGSTIPETAPSKGG